MTAQSNILIYTFKFDYTFYPHSINKVVAQILLAYITFTGHYCIK